MNSQGSWLSILDYAKLKNISISTIRRHIRANKVTHKQIEGKYFIFVDKNDQNLASHSEDLRLKLEIELMKMKLQKLEEENNDLKMLVELYETGQLTSKINNINSLPSLPLS